MNVLLPLSTAVEPTPDRRARLWVILGLVTGTVVQAFALQSTEHFALLSALAAVVWGGTGLASGAVRFGAVGLRVVLGGIAVGVTLAGVFILGALVVRLLPPLAGLIDGFLDNGDRAGLLVTLGLLLLGGVAEELFFRGALWTAVAGAPQVLTTTAVYVVVMIGSLNIMVMFAAAVLGAVTGWERQRTGGIVAPVLTHVVWSTTMFLTLPHLL